MINTSCMWKIIRYGRFADRWLLMRWSSSIWQQWTWLTTQISCQSSVSTALQIINIVSKSKFQPTGSDCSLYLYNYSFWCSTRQISSFTWIIVNVNIGFNLSNRKVDIERESQQLVLLYIGVVQYFLSIVWTVRLEQLVRAFRISTRPVWFCEWNRYDWHCPALSTLRR